MKDFDKMTKAELRAYIVAHTNDQEAFYKFVDRFKADSNDQGWHPFPQSVEDAIKVSKLVQEKIKNLEK